MELREAVCDDLVERKGVLEDVVGPTLDGKTYDQYVEGMRRSGASFRLLACRTYRKDVDEELTTRDVRELH